ncbi:MAG: transcriptional repressor NrdR [Chloroflexi bacterium]|nr:transcriptional repressor NrdR [Chloroflexota bacterium]
MKCPFCGYPRTRVVDTTRDRQGNIRRRRECPQCGRRFSTYERIIANLPMLIKSDGTREAFDRNKLLRGIRMACWKRPVSATDLERLVDDIETRLKAMGRAEVPSRVVGDMVLEGLKELDQVAYIRYAIVYRGLNDLRAIRDEIDRLLAQQ